MASLAQFQNFSVGFIKMLVTTFREAKSLVHREVPLVGCYQIFSVITLILPERHLLNLIQSRNKSTFTLQKCMHLVVLPLYYAILMKHVYEHLATKDTEDCHLNDTASFHSIEHHNWHPTSVMHQPLYKGCVHRC